MQAKKIYILADMEGISGVRKMKQVKEHEAEYAEGRKLMMQDINAAIEGAFQGGATEVIATDTHGGGGQLDLGVMDPRAIYELPACGLLMPSLDSTFAGVILLGHHAQAGTLNGFLDHTMSSATIFECRINDLPVGEIGIEAAYAGHFSVPIIMVAGDQATAEEARNLLGSIECAVVKWGLGRNKARCLSLSQAHKHVQETAQRAVRRAGEMKPFKPTLPAVVQVTYYRSDMADDHISPVSQFGVERVNARTVKRTVQSLRDIWAF